VVNFEAHAAVPHAQAIGMEATELPDGTPAIRLPNAEHLVGDPEKISGPLLKRILELRVRRSPDRYSPESVEFRRGALPVPAPASLYTPAFARVSAGWRGW